MTKTQELLELARVALGGVTDYKLAQVLKLPRQTVSHYRQGTRQADAYAATRIALTLNKDPLEVMASIEAENASTEEKRAFWRSFPYGRLRQRPQKRRAAQRGGFFWNNDKCFPA